MTRSAGWPMLPAVRCNIGKDDDGNTVDLGVNETRRLLESIPNSIVQALNYSNVSVDAKRDDNGLYIEIVVHKSDTPVFYQGSKTYRYS